MMARFPERPTKDQKAALRSFIYLFSRLYPCGEWYVVTFLTCLVNATKFINAIGLVSTCSAKEFQMILEKHPPQVSSRQHRCRQRHVENCHCHGRHRSKYLATPAVAVLAFVVPASSCLAADGDLLRRLRYSFVSPHSRLRVDCAGRYSVSRGSRTGKSGNSALQRTT